MADIKQIKVGDTTYNIEPVTSYYKVGRADFEMNSSGSLKGYGGFIDFHFFNSSGQPLDSSGGVVSSTPDYTSRIIEDSAGCININGTYIAWTGLISGYIKSNGSIDATTFYENGTSLANKYAAAGHTHTSLNTAFVFNNRDMPQEATNLSTTTAAHKINFYRNGLSIPYQAEDPNDGGILRCRGNSESNVIFELGTWDDSGAGETIQFNYYPITSQITPAYSVSVPKKTGTIALTSDIPTSLPASDVYD